VKEDLIKISNVTKSYNKKIVLDNVTLNIEKGKIYGFIGQNGAGKTTLIKILMGLSFADHGTLEIFGEKDSKGLEKARKSIGCMVEHTGLYPNFTAKKNLTLQCKYKGLSEKEEINRVLKIVGLHEMGSKKFKNFSMGMKQRLAIAVALIGNPKLIILDEPVNGLDPIGISEIREMLLKLNAEKDITILISSHILGELYMLATDYLIIDDGKIVDMLTLEQLDEKCKMHIIIETESIEDAKIVLDDFGLKNRYSEMKDQKIRIMDANVDVKLLAKSFYKAGVILTELSYSGKSLENYFLETVGGMQNV
jgi:ABC-2 type transport system ATP-binding protein